VPQQQLQLDIHGMTCAACAVRLEKVLNKLPGMTAQVNFASNTASMQFPSGMLSLADAQEAVRKAGFTATPQADAEAVPALQQTSARMARSWPGLPHPLLTLPFLLDMLAMLFGWHGLMLSRGWQLALATPVQLHRRLAFLSWRMACAAQWRCQYGCAGGAGYQHGLVILHRGDPVCGNTAACVF
jgi:Cu+-exporting ATPase